MYLNFEETVSSGLTEMASGYNRTEFNFRQVLKIFSAGFENIFSRF